MGIYSTKTYDGQSLIQSYVAKKLRSGMNKTDIARELSELFGRTYKIQKLNLWLKGTTSVPRHFHDFMLYYVLPDVIKDCTGRQIPDLDAVIERLAF